MYKNYLFFIRAHYFVLLRDAKKKDSPKKMLKIKSKRRKE